MIFSFLPETRRQCRVLRGLTDRAGFAPTHTHLTADHSIMWREADRAGDGPPHPPHCRQSRGRTPTPTSLQTEQGTDPRTHLTVTGRAGDGPPHPPHCHRQSRGRTPAHTSLLTTTSCGGRASARSTRVGSQGPARPPPVGCGEEGADGWQQMTVPGPPQGHLVWLRPPPALLPRSFFRLLHHPATPL